MSTALFIFSAVIGAMCMTLVIGIAALNWLERRMVGQDVWAVFEILAYVAAGYFGYMVGVWGWI